jgi:hypothetical protein
MEHTIGDYTIRYCFDADTIVPDYIEVYDGFGDLIGTLSYFDYDEDDEDLNLEELEQFIELNLIPI